MAKDGQRSKAERFLRAFVFGEWHTLEELDWATQGAYFTAKYLLRPLDRALNVYYEIKDDITRRLGR